MKAIARQGDEWGKIRWCASPLRLREGPRQHRFRRMRPTVLEKQLERLRAMTPEEKIRASDDLRRGVWELKAAWFRSLDPDLSETAVQNAVKRWIGGATP